MASTVNRTDAGFRSAEYFISRFWSGLFRPKFPVLGCEFAGIVEEVGADASLVILEKLYIPVVESKAEIIEGDPDEKAEKLASILVKGGLV